MSIRSQLNQLVESIPLSIAMFDTEMRYLVANKMWMESYELGDRDILGKSHYEIFPEIGEDWKAIHQRCLQGEIDRNEGAPFPREDGSLDWVRWEVRPWYAAGEEIGGLIMYTEVITERKLAEQINQVQRDMALAVSRAAGTEEIWRLCMEAALEAAQMDAGVISLVDEKTGDVEAAYTAGLPEAFVAQIAYFAAGTPEASLIMAGEPVYTHYAELGLGAADSEEGQALRAFALLPIWYEGRVVGALSTASRRFEQVPDYARQILEVVGAQMGSVIARARSESALKASEARFRNLFDMSADPALLLVDGRFTDCNRAAVEILRAGSKADVLDTPPDALSPEFQPDGQRSSEKTRGLIEAALSEGSQRFEWVHRRFDGEDFYVEVVLTAIPLGERQILHTTWRDITERKQMEQNLRDSEEEYRTLFEATGDAVMLLDREIFFDCNPAALEMFGCERRDQLLGKPPSAFSPTYQPGGEASDDLALHHIQKAMREGSALFEWQHMRLDGTEFPAEVFLSALELRGEPVLQAVVRDITERKEMQAAQTRRARLYSRFSTLLVRLLSPMPLDAKLRQITGWVVEQLDGDFCRIWTVQEEPDGRYLDLQASSGRYTHTDGPHGRVSFDSDGKLGRLTGGGASKFVTNDVVNEPSIDDPDWAREIGLASLAAYRLSTPEGEVLGVLALFSQHTIDQEDEAFLESVAGATSLVIRTAVLEEESARLAEARERDLQVVAEHRAEQVQLSTEVAQEIAAAQEVGEIFRRVVTLVKERFDYYHAQIFRYEPAVNAVVLVEGYGETGKKMLAQGHQLQMGRGVVGTALATGEAVLASDVTQDPNWVPNPNLPDTKGEVAVPILWRNETLGILDVQSSTAGALTRDDQLLLEGLCGQIAIAIQNANLREEMEESLRELNNLYRTMSREGWEQFREMSDTLPNYLFERSELRRADDLWTPEIGQAAAHKTMIFPMPDNGALVNPLAVRGGEIIGALGIYDDPQNPLSTEDMALIAEVTEQVALALESARLFKQTQDTLAETEVLYRTSREIGNAATVEAVLDGAAELVRYMQMQNVSLRLITDRTEEGTPKKFDLYSLVLENGSRETSFFEGLPFDETSREMLMAYPDLVVLYADAENPDSDMPERVRENLLKGGNRGAVSAWLEVRGQVIGILSFVSPYPLDELSERYIRLITTVTDQVATAIDNIQLLRQTEESLAETEALYRTSAALTSATHVDEILEAILEYAQSPAFDRCVVAMLDDPDAAPEAWTVEMRAVWDREGREALYRGNRYTAAQFPLIQKALSYDTLAINHVASDPQLDEASRTILTSLEIQSLLVVPMSTGRRLFGWLMVEAIQQSHDFQAREVQNFRTIAEQAAVVLYSQRLLTESTRRAQEMGFLFEVTQAATAGAITDLESALAGVADVVHQFMNAAEVDILVPEDERGALRTMVCTRSEDIGQYIPYDRDTASVIWVMNHVEPLIISDTQSNGRFDDFSNPTRSAMVTPIAAGGQLSGIIQVQSAVPSAYDEQTLRLLQTMAGALHAVIQNARLLEEVTAANERLLELDRLKSEFLASTSHELRTPLNSIIGFSRLLLKGIGGPLTEMQQQDLMTIHKNGQHLLQLINDILDQSKIEAGQMELDTDYFSLEEVIDGAISTTSGMASEKPIEIIKDVAPDLPQAWGDEFRTRQALINLVGNAIKFTDRGNVTVSAYLREMPDGPDMLHIAITDTGIGIAEEHLDILFEAFRQVDSTTTRKYAGTGLGLPITKALIELQGGSIWVESEMGEGSIFTFTIPTEPVEDMGETPAEDSEAEGKPAESITVMFDDVEEDEGESEDAAAPEMPPMIVVLDDEQNVINLYQRYLTGKGFEVVGTTDPEKLNQMIFAFQPKIVLLDVVIPGSDVNGLDILKQLKEDPETQDIEAIVCSVVEEQERAEALGAAAYLVKPFGEEALVRAVRRVSLGLSEDEMPPPGEEAPRTEEPVQPPPDGPRVVLVLDDEQGVINLYKRYLTTRGYEVIGTTDPDKVDSLIAQFHPSLILLDVIIPDHEIDGWQVLERLKADPATRNIPAVICTVVDDPERGKAMGASEYLVKPFSEEELVKAVRRAEQGAAPPAKKEPSVVLALDDEQGVINLYKRYLTGAGYEVVGTTDPTSLDALVAEVHPSVILLDVVIPDYDTDGWHILKQLKADPATRDIPVVVCTIVDDPERGKEMGAAAYLVKPFLEDDLVKAVQQVELEKFGEK